MAPGEDRCQLYQFASYGCNRLGKRLSRQGLK
jgi:hypothetical protein